MIYWKRVWDNLGDFGANRVHFGPRIGTPEIAQNHGRIIRVLHTYAYFIVLNVPNDRMTHPWDGVFLGLAKTIHTYVYIR
jgi:hypothetical protein